MTIEKKPILKAPMPPSGIKSPAEAKISAYTPSMKTNSLPNEVASGNPGQNTSMPQPSYGLRGEDSSGNKPENFSKNQLTEEQPSVSPGSGLYDNNFAAQFNLPPSILTTKAMSFILAGVFFFGIIFGANVFGTSTTTHGLQGVILNPGVPEGRKRCGIAEKTEGCVLFMMNASQRDREVRSFYEQAAAITNVPAYTIEMGNITYASTIIRPGYFAQINIPPIR